MRVDLIRYNSTNDYTDCYPSNGIVEATPTLSFNPVGPPTGLSPTLTYVWYYGAALFSLKWFIQWIVFFKPSKMLGAKPIGYLIPFYDVSYTFYLFLFGILKQFTKPKKWK